MAVVFAVGTLTSTGNPANTETVTIGGKAYTFQTTLTNVDGNVLIGADAQASLANLYAAINLEAGAGTTYAAATVVNHHVVATSKTATTVVVKSKIPGTIGNLIATTETSTVLSWGGAVLASGSGSIAADIRTLIAESQLKASVHQALVDMVDPEENE